MQMYRVKFANKLGGNTVDLGDAIVCAQNADAACDMVSMLLALPKSGVEMEVHRVKPSFYQVSRRQVKESVSTFEAELVNADVTSTATFPGVTESRRDWHSFEVQAQATIRAGDENEAITKLAIGIQREMSGARQKRSITDLDIKCDRKEFHPRSPAVEENALYTFRQIFQGGDTRT